jgi:transposase-like protein
MKKLSPFPYFKTSPDVIRLAVMMYVRFPLSLRQVEDLLFERGDRYVSRDGAVVVESVRSVGRLPTSRPGIDDVGVAALLEVRI